MFEKAFNDLILKEGGYSDHPSDNGGQTMYGISAPVARLNGYTGDISAMPLSFAREVYKKRYWDVLKLDQISRLSQKIGAELFDTAVNMGQGTAAIFLQRIINCITAPGSLTVDGKVGQLTLQKFASMDKYFETILIALNAQQCVRYMEISEKDPKQAIFLKGWINKRVRIT